MRSKAPLALMEQVVMVLVFALATALCLQVFVFSNQVSKRNAAIDHAVLEAQNAAETIKAAGDIAILMDTMDAQVEDQALLVVHYDQDWNLTSSSEGVYRLLAQNCSDRSGLGKAQITVDDGTGQDTLFSLTVAWQEVSGNG